MFKKYVKLSIIIALFYHSPVYSKSKTLNEFDLNNLSNYFSGVIAYKNNDNLEALKFLRSSKFLINKHKPYLKKYIYSLVLEAKTHQAINEIKQHSTNNNISFFEAYLILSLDSLKKRNFKKSKNYLEKSYEFINNDRFALIIYETLKQYLNVFEENKIFKVEKKFGNLSFINEAFQRCYLDDTNTHNYFKQLINNENNSDYSRYIYFNINYLVEKNRIEEAEALTNKINYLNSTLLISQAKKWVEEKQLDNFNKIFSCKNPSDIISEFFFIIANIYSSQEDYEQSNFYSNISHYLNPKFKFNLSLLVENYYFGKNYIKAKKTLNYFNEKDNFYYWFKLKKQAQIIAKNLDDNQSLDFINKKFKKIKDPSIKQIFDIANLNKNSKNYQNAIAYYNEIIPKIEPNSNIYAEILFRRGGSYERLGNYKQSDSDLIKALEIDPDNAYILNYLAYSWLERNYKIDTAMQMLEKAYEVKNDDPYIIDSIGWAYYLVDDFLKAEKFIRKAVELMPDDPIVNDHYGDILWMLDKKIQARYFWTNVLNLEETEDKMKKNINVKLIEGIKNLNHE